MIKALVVDDERIVRQGLISLTDWSQFNITFVGEAKDGVQALTFLDEHDVDLMFVDITMPSMTGFELIKKVQLRFPHIKFIIVTCHHEFDHVKEALQLGVLDYIVKTLLDRENVIETMTRIIDRFEREQLSHPIPEEMTYEGGVYYVTSPSIAENEKIKVMKQYKIELIEIGQSVYQAKLVTPSSLHRYPFIEGEFRGCWIAVPAMKSFNESQIHQWLKQNSHTYVMYSDDLKIFKLSEQLLTDKKWLQLEASTTEQWKSETEQYRWLVYSQDFIKWTAMTERVKPEAIQLLAYITTLYDNFVALINWDGEIKKELSIDSITNWKHVYQWCQRLSLYIKGRIDEYSLTSEVSICLLKSVNVMKQKMNSEITQEEVAYKVGMSRSYFSLCFKRFYGHSFGELLRQLRIAEAKKMLVLSKYNIAEIAQHVGFEDTKYFSRTFKHYVHVYPSEYRILFSEVNHL